MKILERIKKERLYFDGGMGTMLQSVLEERDELPEQLNASEPEVIESIHRKYLDAGCDIISTNTFGANSLKFSNFEELIEEAFKCAKNAVEGRKDKYIAFSMGPLGRMLKPLGDLDFEEAVKIFSASVKKAAECGADVILFETMSDCYETKAAVLAAKESCDLPVFVTNAYDEKGRLMTGAQPEAMIAMLEGLGADAIGMNCSFGPDKMMEILPVFTKYASVPIIVNPNAGLPTVKDGKTVYNIDADAFSDIMVDISLKGGCLLGGCCGTTPEYIKKTVEKTKKIKYTYPGKKEYTLVGSYTHAVEIGDGVTLIGERINPTGKKKFKEALKENNISYILNEALAQEEKGVHILDVNVGLPEIDEKEMMKAVVTQLQEVTSLPLQIDSSSCEVLEESLRLYNGKPLVNSVDASERKLNAVLPLVKKYGAAVIGLTMDENGIPETAQKRAELAKKIADRAFEYGIESKDIIIDPLALTVSSDSQSARVTLKAIELIKNMGLKTSLGVSNISFGLPRRDLINSAFFVMAMERGLDCAIMNPFSQQMMDAYNTFSMLNGKDEGCKNYIEYASAQSEEKNEKVIESDISLSYAVKKGLKNEAENVAKLLSETGDALKIINSEIIPSLDIVGKDFENNKIYLPQLLMCAEAATAAFNILKEKIPAENSKTKNTVIIATVEGDIHDIGKNIVKALLESFGFNVIDLGKDVPAEKIVREVKKTSCKLVGLSALMTTTVRSMEETIKLLEKEVPDVKTIVGGAVLTQDYAKMIGASFYAGDAMEAVKCAKQFFGEV